MTLSELKAPRAVGLTDGAQAARQRAVDVDRALSDLYVTSLGDNARICVVAVGGYGRGELSPHSDIDLLFLFPGKRPDDVSIATLRNVLYPLWDAGFQVGHASVTAKQAIERCAGDLHAATSLLTARLVAGPPDPFEELLDRRTRMIAKNRRGLVRRVLEATQERHRTVDRAGWMLAPDIRNDIGGLRDANTAQWIDGLTSAEGLRQELIEASDILLAVREGLHAESPRKLDRVRIDLQPSVARRLGLTGDSAADVLMEAVHSAARTIEHSAKLLIERRAEAVLGGPKRSGSIQHLDAGVIMEDGRLRLPQPPAGVAAALTLLAAVAATGRPVVPEQIDDMATVFITPGAMVWGPDNVDSFLQILRGPHVDDALELLDHLGGWPILMPEWVNIRGRAQHDPYHRYTVDGHSFRAVAAIARFTDEEPLARTALEETGDNRVLYLATLLHDIGKGSGENHSIAGARLARGACERMGFDQRSINDVVQLVRHHLLLSDTATRRDIDDGTVVASVADAIGDPRVLRLLYVLSGADGMATGRASWTDWKSSLVAQLYRRVLVALESGELPERSDVASRLRELEAYDPLVVADAERILGSMPPSYLSNTPIEDLADDVRLLSGTRGAGEISCRIDPGTESGQCVVTVCVPDRPGTLAKTAGVLTLHRMSVLTAQAYSAETGVALERFIVAAPLEPRWEAFQTDLAAAYSGRLALDARIEQKARDYRAAAPVVADIRVLQDESEHSTVLEIRAPDALGLLYAVTSAISELGLNIHVAKIDTLGERVVDVFYIRSLDGAKIDEIQAAELDKAIDHRVRRLFA